MKLHFFLCTLAFCLCSSSVQTAHAWQEGFSLQGDVWTEESTSEPVGLADEADITPVKVYNAMIALKNVYPDGTVWTNDEPYSDTKGYYYWNGGNLDGKRISAVGCVAFAFRLSDEAFGNLQARMYENGEFEYEDIKVGDILRVNGDTHTVIVLEVSDTGVVIAEGNISTGDHKGKVHWGRTMSKEEVMRDTSHYITRYPEGYVSPEDPDANNIITEGTLEGGLRWNLIKAGTLTVSGSGTMPDFNSAGEQPWNSYSSQIRKVVIEEGVTSIGACAFWNCGVLGAEIPSSVKTIGNSAFRGSSIISITIPSGVTAIGDSAFRECAGLSSVTVSEGVETIEQNAFRACTDLTSIALPASIEKVGTAAFFECAAMISATFTPGSNQVKMGDDLFARCYSLISVTLPPSIDCIGNRMFQNCLNLAGIEIPQGAESIGELAFASSAVSVVIIPDSVTTIGIAAFSACPLKNIYFTGSEEQWEKISKIGDTASAVSKATIEYNHTPTAPNPDDGSDSGNNDGDDSEENNGDDTGENSGSGSEENNGDSVGDNSGDGTGDNSGSGSEENNGDSAGDNSGDSTGNNSGSGSEENNGDSAGDNSGDGTGDNSGSGSEENNGDSAGDNSGDSTGNNSGSGSGNNIEGGSGDNGSDRSDSSTDFIDNIINMISAAEEGGTVVITRDQDINALSNSMMKALSERNDVSLVLECVYEGIDYTIVIPAGEAIDNDIPWYGPLYLVSIYGDSTSPAAKGGLIYTVQKNDTMSRIARAYGMSLAELVKLNPQVADINQISIGQIINIK